MAQGQMLETRGVRYRGLYAGRAGSRAHFGALLLGYYDKSKKLIYAGRVGTGFNEKTIAALHKKLSKLVQPKSPYSNLSGTAGQARGVSWVKPVLVAEIQFRTGPTICIFGIRHSRGSARTSPPARSSTTSPCR